jgi:hypothetical protein
MVATMDMLNGVVVTGWVFGEALLVVFIFVTKTELSVNIEKLR